MSLVRDVLDGVTAPFDSRLVYAEPVERGSVTVIPAAAVFGGGGGGTGDEPGVGADGSDRDPALGSHEEPGGGGGFGLRARPVGAWIIQGDSARWQPTIDVTRLAVIGAVATVVGLVLARSAWRRSRRRTPGPDQEPEPRFGRRRRAG